MAPTGAAAFSMDKIAKIPKPVELALAKMQKTGCYSDLERAVSSLRRVHAKGGVTEAIFDVSLWEASTWSLPRIL